MLSITQDSDEEESEATTEPGTIRPRLTRELRALGITSTEAGSANESENKSTDASNKGNEPPRATYSAITSLVQMALSSTGQDAFSRGFMQIPVVDYTESVALMASDSGIRL
jgi:hypothetical protein